MVIKVLPPELCDQIAAGEVIKNPASLLKELIENSLDAQATSISITLEQAGFSKIVVEDNGFGISKDDLPLAPKRYATSKISSFEDLYTISTMGFRGEALASIFSVAKVILESKTKNQEYAYKISNNNLHPKKTALENGTRITIEDLFYNTPARKKYLRSQALEMRSILEVIKLISLIHPHLQLKVIHNSKKVFDKMYLNSISQSMYSVLELPFKTYEEFKSLTYEIQTSTPQCIISAIMLNPNELNYSSKKHIKVYVNSRPIISQLIIKAIMAGIGTNIHSGRYPLCILNIIIDPEIIDVNVHPAKEEIKFEQEHIIFDTVFKAVKEIFEKEILFKSSKSSKHSSQTSLQFLKKLPEQFSSDSLKTQSIKNNTKLELNFKRKSESDSLNVVSRASFKTSKLNKSYFNSQRQQELVGVGESPHLDIKSSKYEEEISTSVRTPRIIEQELSTSILEKGPLYEYLEEFRVVGQVHKTFILLETRTSMLVIDQHVVEEKFYFELFRQYLEQKKVKTQQLLDPIILKINSDEFIVFNHIKTYLEQLGFEVDSLQENEIIIRALPLDLKGRVMSTKIIEQLLETLDNENISIFNSKSIPQELLHHLSTLACKSSIRAGEELTISQMYELVEKLKYLKEPFNCPHGRPIMISYSYQDLYKQFGRS